MENETSEIRSFIAIELPVEVREQLLILENKLKGKLNIPASWVKPDNIHLTLKFLGNVPQEKISYIGDALTTIMQQVPPFYLELDAPGAFPNAKRPRILWVGLAGDLRELVTLHKDIDTVLNCLGFPPENRPFSPHLTLCRIRENMPATLITDIGHTLNTVEVEDNARFQVVELTLFKSLLTPGGPIYTRLITVECKRK